MTFAVEANLLAVTKSRLKLAGYHEIILEMSWDIEDANTKAFRN
jgi:hypothetical protein